MSGELTRVESFLVFNDAMVGYARLATVNDACLRAIAYAAVLHYNISYIDVAAPRAHTHIAHARAHSVHYSK